MPAKPSSPPQPSPNLGERPSRTLARRLESELLHEVAVGDRLPTERDIAKRHGVGRTIVREALLILELQGLVRTKKGSGTRRVEPFSGPSPPASPPNEAPLDAAAAVGIGPFELIQARVVIEAAVTELAARTITATDLKALRAALERHAAALTGELDDRAHAAIEEHDVAFHLGIARATHNDALLRNVTFVRTYRGGGEEWDVFLQIVERDRAQLEQAFQEHRTILAALVARDGPGAAEAMRRHIHRKSARLRCELERQGAVLDTRLFDTTPFGATEVAGEPTAP